MTQFLATVAAVVATVTMTAAASWGAEPAFDCSKTEHEIEDLVCKTDLLAELDQELADVYQEALGSLQGLQDEDEATRNLKATQRGWIKGRNDCWKATDKEQCVQDSYEARISDLQARYALVVAPDAVKYTCEGNAANPIMATFIPTRLPTVRLERGDETVIGWLTESGSGSKYTGEAGIVFWTEGDDAQVEWPQGNSFACKVLIE